MGRASRTLFLNAQGCAEYPLQILCFLMNKSFSNLWCWLCGWKRSSGPRGPIVDRPYGKEEPDPCSWCYSFFPFNLFKNSAALIISTSFPKVSGNENISVNNNRNLHLTPLASWTILSTCFNVKGLIPFFFTTLSMASKIFSSSAAGKTTVYDTQFHLMPEKKS